MQFKSPPSWILPILILLGSLISSSVVAGCWTPQDRGYFRQSEMEGTVILSFKDAVSCSPITNADIALGGQKYTTDSRGYLRLADTGELMDERLPLLVKKRGYITWNSEVRFELGGVVHNRFALSPQMSPSDTRFVLTWHFEPEDLDLHLRGSGFHISARDQKSAKGAQLNQTASDGWGPETITLTRIDSGERYQLFVENRSRSGFVGPLARVEIYQNNRLAKRVLLPRTGKDRVEILIIRNGQLEYTGRPL